MLLHSALIMDDILADDNGILTGVVHWECASALPMWKACDFPDFLSSKPRYKEPDQYEFSLEDYMKNTCKQSCANTFSMR
jgi:hypothetical protein